MIPLTKYLHYDIEAYTNNVIQVIFDASWVNVFLLDEFNYQNYLNNKRYSYYGGLAEVSPFNLRPPYYNKWHLVIDRGGENFTATVSVKVV